MLEKAYDKVQVDIKDCSCKPIEEEAEVARGV